MKKIVCFTLAFACAFPMVAQDILKGEAQVRNLNVGKISEKMVVSMDIVPQDSWNVKSNQSVVLTPRLSNGVESMELPAIEILGRNQFLFGLRNDKLDANTYKASETQTISYLCTVPYESWMDGSTLTLGEDLCGCCRTVLWTGGSDLGGYSEPAVFTPVFAYIVPKAEAIKARSESGHASVVFHVSKTDIDPAYGNNNSELQNILNTINSIRGDKDLTITEMAIVGKASPEGKYSENERLAKARTEAVAEYVRERLADRKIDISTSYVAENWQELREYVEESDLPRKQAILEVIDSPDYADSPDAREWKMKTTFPEEYAELLADCYPKLRRTDYKVEYTIRPFSTEEARRLIESSPQKLSLQEMYNVAQIYEPGSDAYNDVFETAVRMFPDDPVANLNAANSALKRNDVRQADKYLSKAGDTAEAVLARGISAMLKGDPETAERLMTEARAMGCEAAAANLESVAKCRDK